MTKNPKIYYLAPDFDKPAGGIKVLYNHVDLLNELGYDASVLHSKKGFKSTWFRNESKIAYFNEVIFSESDVIVIPEIYFHLLSAPKITQKERLKKLIGHKLDYFTAKEILKMSVKKVIFNQNAYHTLLDFTAELTPRTEYLENFTGYLSISDHNKDYIQYIFPNLTIHRVKWSLDFNLLQYQPDAKKKIISYMPRKNEDHVKQVISILKLRNNLEGYELMPIQNQNEAGVAEILNKSTIFLSFGYPEGLPLPPAEAMASGCYVIGYHGGGGQEYFKPEHSQTVPFGDIITFCKEVEVAVKISSVELKNKMEAASVFIRKHYSKEIEKELLNTSWQQILA